jgi:TP901 family phage tail tape measure protein
MASGKFIIGVSAKIDNISDLEKQLGNLHLSKSISVPVELKGGDKAIKTINTFRDSAGQTVKQVEIFNKTTGQTESYLKQVSLNFDRASKAAHPFANSLSKLMQTGAKVAVFSVLSTGINAVKDAFASTIDIVKDFDDALTEFKKVSDLSGQALNDYAKQLGELGSTVARSTTEMVQGASAFRKMGFSDEDSAKLAQTNAMFQNIADSEMSAEESAKILIGTMKGFDLTASSVEHISDVINEVSNTSAVSSTDIANGLANVSAVSKAMGNSLEETVGMLTAMTEVSQSAGKSSRGLRQIMTRLSQTLDDSSKTGKDLREIYKSLGVEIFDQQGQIKSTTQILSGLAEHWKDLSRNEQENIALKSAGSNQINNFLALLDHWDRAVEATNTALDSNGSAMRENERYMESLSA